VLADIRGSAFKSNAAKRQRYADLFDAVRRTHVDYVSIFTFLRDSCRFDRENIGAAKTDFLSARRALSSDRELTKADASAYLHVAEDLGERRFIAATLWYYHYEDSEGYDLDSNLKIDSKINLALSHDDGAERNWDSASTLLWAKIKDSNDYSEIAEFAKTAIYSITARFNAVVVSYTELEGAWKYDRPVRPSIIAVRSGQ